MSGFGPIDPIRHPIAAGEAIQAHLRRQQEAAFAAGLIVPSRPPTPPTPEQLEAEKRAATARRDAYVAACREARPTLLAALDRHRDVTERLVLAARHWGPPPGNPSLATFKQRHRGAKPPTRLVFTAVDPGLWANAFPDLWADETQVSLDASVPPWDTHAIAKWFAARAQRSGRKPPRSFPGSGFRRAQRGWSFDATAWNPSSANGETPPRPKTVTISDRGRILFEDHHLAITGLRQIADEVGLQDDALDLPKG
jgi:hypothetical protein